ncbi:MAG: Crp/Fnr family transcriptional regulator [Pseudomonadota bacterium]
MNDKNKFFTSKNNNLLSALSEKDLSLLQPHLITSHVEKGQVLYNPGDLVTSTYFPCDATLISFFVVLNDSKIVETTLIGREGAVGGIVSQGNIAAYCKAEVQHAGVVLCIKSKALEEAKSQSPTLHHFFARYADCLMSQIFQSVACNAAHTIEQRLAKWILSANDRTNNNILSLSQEHLSNMLGVGRSYLTRVISAMKEKNAISTTRGKIHIQNKSLLESIACDCNNAVKKHFEEVLNGIYPN